MQNRYYIVLASSNFAPVLTGNCHYMRPYIYQATLSCILCLEFIDCGDRYHSVDVIALSVLSISEETSLIDESDEKEIR